MNIDKEKYFTLTVIAEMNFDDVPKSNGFIFTVPGCFRKEAFFNEDDSPNEMASHFISKFLVEALAGNIHTSHQQGHIDSAEHLREIISRLEDLFVSNCTVDIGTVDKKGWIKKKKKKE
jgi:hypothetical protein